MTVLEITPKHMFSIIHNFVSQDLQEVVEKLFYYYLKNLQNIAHMLTGHDVGNVIRLPCKHSENKNFG